MLPIKIEIDMTEFSSEFEDLADWVKRIAKDEIQALIKKDPRWKEFVKKKANEAVERVIGDK